MLAGCGTRTSSAVTASACSRSFFTKPDGGSAEGSTEAFQPPARAPPPPPPVSSAPPPAPTGPLPGSTAVTSAIQRAVVRILGAAGIAFIPDERTQQRLRGQDVPLRHYTTNESRDLIIASGVIRTNAEGFNWVTPDYYQTGAAAKMYLTLNRRPDGYFEFSSGQVDGFVGAGRVRPMFNEPGGGIEIVSNRPISIAGARWVPIVGGR